MRRLDLSVILSLPRSYSLMVVSSLTSHVLPWSQLATVKITRFMSLDRGGEFAPRRAGSASFVHLVRLVPVAIEFSIAQVGDTLCLVAGSFSPTVRGG
jgi:hypothetical protein